MAKRTTPQSPIIAGGGEMATAAKGIAPPPPNSVEGKGATTVAGAPPPEFELALTPRRNDPAGTRAGLRAAPGSATRRPSASGTSSCAPFPGAAGNPQRVARTTSPKHP